MHKTLRLFGRNLQDFSGKHGSDLAASKKRIFADNRSKFVHRLDVLPVVQAEKVVTRSRQQLLVENASNKLAYMQGRMHRWMDRSKT